MKCTPGGEPVADYLDAYYRILDEMKRQMICAPRTGSISRDFITQMIPHHRAAVEMCENLLRYISCGPLSDLARTIIRQQTQGIAEMEEILPSCGAVRNRPQEVCRYQKRNARVLDTMFSAMTRAGGVGVEQNFLREMIPHHEGAVQMSQNALGFRICQPLRPILQNIIATQEREIGEMRQMLTDVHGNAGVRPNEQKTGPECRRKRQSH